MKYVDPLPADHVPETGFLQTVPGTSVEIRCEQYVTAGGVDLGLIAYKIFTDPDGVQYSEYDPFEEME